MVDGNSIEFVLCPVFDYYFTSITNLLFQLLFLPME